MANVAKHYSKEKGESDHVEGCGVHLLVLRSAVCNNYLVEGPDELVHLEVSGRLHSQVIQLFNLCNSASGTISHWILKRCLHLRRNPEESKIDAFVVDQLVKIQVYQFSLSDLLSLHFEQRVTIGFLGFMSSDQKLFVVSDRYLNRSIDIVNISYHFLQSLIDVSHTGWHIELFSHKRIAQQFELPRQKLLILRKQHEVHSRFQLVSIVVVDFLLQIEELHVGYSSRGSVDHPLEPQLFRSVESTHKGSKLHSYWGKRSSQEVGVFLLVLLLILLHLQKLRLTEYIFSLFVEVNWPEQLFCICEEVLVADLVVVVFVKLLDLLCLLLHEFLFRVDLLLNVIQNVLLVLCILTVINLKTEFCANLPFPSWFGLWFSRVPRQRREQKSKCLACHFRRELD